MYAVLKRVRARFEEHAVTADKDAFRSDLRELVRLYAFLSQILPYEDTELERLYLFARHLVRHLPVEKERLPREIQDQIDMESWGIRKTHEGGIELGRGPEGLEPRGAKGHAMPPPDQRDRLSEIIKELNDRYGAGLTEEDRLSLETLEKRLTGDAALQAAARSNTRSNVRLTFGTKVQDYLQDMADSNFKLYKRITDDREFGSRLLDPLFEEFWQEVGEG